MSCNTCAKSFGLLRKEKGCPGCGFSYCSNCLQYKIILAKTSREAKVCVKCNREATSAKSSEISPPDAFYKRLEKSNEQSNVGPPSTTARNTDDIIQERLKKLKEDLDKPNKNTEQEIADRLKNIKGDMPTATDDEIRERLAQLRGVPVSVVQSQPVIPLPDHRTEQEQADDLLKQYLEQTQIDSKYKNEFDTVIESMSDRLLKLKGQDGSSKANIPGTSATEDYEQDEEELIRAVLEKYKREVQLEADNSNEAFMLPTKQIDELPFCEICNEDARMRCLGCRYLFCKRCFIEHKDDDDGCNRYEEYNPPKSG